MNFQIFRDLNLSNVSVKDCKVPIYHALPTNMVGADHGKIIFNDTTNIFYGYNGTMWVPLHGLSPVVNTQSWQYLNGTLAPNPGFAGSTDINVNFLAPLPATSIGDAGTYLMLTFQENVRAGTFGANDWTSFPSLFTVAFGHNNIARNNSSNVAGGNDNVAHSAGVAILNGTGNLTFGDAGSGFSTFSCIGNGNNNGITGTYSTILGGNDNLVYTDFASIGNGTNNVINAVSPFSVIANGSNSVISGLINDTFFDKANVILNGTQNGITGGYNVIINGSNNKLTSFEGSGIANGATCAINVFYGLSTIINGQNNNIVSNVTDTSEDYYNIIGGGQFNNITGATIRYNSINGGLFNTITESTFSTIGGGSTCAITNSVMSSIISGTNNSILDSSFTTIGGGDFNGATGSTGSIIFGGSQNNVTRAYNTIGGGALNRLENASTWPGIILGGQDNFGTLVSVIGGGLANTSESVCIGGYGNVSSNGSLLEQRSIVLGGTGNIAETGTIGGGNANYITSQGSIGSFIGGGSGNLINTINDNIIFGGHKNAIGQLADVTFPSSSNIICGNANATRGGSIESTIFCGSTNTMLTTNNSFIMAGTNNYMATNDYAFIYSGAGNTMLSTHSAILQGSVNFLDSNVNILVSGNYCTVTDNDVFMLNTSTNIGPSLSSTANSQVLVRAPNGIKYYTDNGLTLGAELSTGGVAWSALSDERFKENIILVDPAKIMESLSRVPIVQYNYKDDPNKHIYRGPIAQDWHAAFPTNKSPKHIDTMDIDGVSIAAIKNLYSRLKNINQKLTRIN